MSKKSREHMKAAVARLQEYMSTYNKQPGYEDYTADTFIHDVIYGIGIALDPDEYRMGGGYEKFKRRVIALLEE